MCVDSDSIDILCEYFLKSLVCMHPVLLVIEDAVHLGPVRNCPEREENRGGRFDLLKDNGSGNEYR